LFIFSLIRLKDEFNPLRWLDPVFPTYKEPLTQYPSLRNITQYGYGHRTCQGQGVAEADMIVAIGALAWLFDMKQTNSKSKIAVNEKTSLSEEELVTGLESNNFTQQEDEDIDSDVEDDAPPTSSSLVDRIERIRRSAINKIKQNWKRKDAEARNEHDETLNFSTLLIAKPLPFNFQLQIRNPHRAALIEELYQKQKDLGEFADSRNYCKLTSSHQSLTNS
jgi:hypothetical protein